MSHETKPKKKKNAHSQTPQSFFFSVLFGSSHIFFLCTSWIPRSLFHCFCCCFFLDLWNVWMRTIFERWNRIFRKEMRHLPVIYTPNWSFVVKIDVNIGFVYLKLMSLACSLEITHLNWMHILMTKYTQQEYVYVFCI